MFQKITTLMLILLSMIALISQAATPPPTTTISKEFAIEAKGKTTIPLDLVIPGYVKIELTWKSGTIVTALVEKNGNTLAPGVKHLASPVTIIQEVKESDFKRGAIYLEISDATTKMTGKATITRLNVAPPVDVDLSLTPAQKSALMVKHRAAVKNKIEELNRAKLTTSTLLSSKATTYRNELKNAYLASKTTRIADISRLDGAQAQPVPRPGNIPILTDVQPREVLSGMTITLTGSNFKNNDRVVFKNDNTSLGNVPGRIISPTSMTVEVPVYAYDAYKRGSVTIERPIIGGVEKSVSKTIWYMPNVPAIQSFSANYGTCNEDIILNISGIQDTPVGTVIFKDERSTIRVTPTDVNWTANYGVRVRIPSVSQTATEGLKPFARKKSFSVSVEWNGKTSQVRQFDIMPEFEYKWLNVDQLNMNSAIKIATPANQAASDQSKSYSWIPGKKWYAPEYYSYDKYETVTSEANGIYDTLVVVHKGSRTQGFRGVDKLYVGNTISSDWVIYALVFSYTRTVYYYADADSSLAGEATITNSPEGRSTAQTEISWWNQPVLYSATPCAPTVRYTLSYVGYGPKLIDY